MIRISMQVRQSYFARGFLGKTIGIRDNCRINIFKFSTALEPASHAEINNFNLEHSLKSGVVPKSIVDMNLKINRLSNAEMFRKEHQINLKHEGKPLSNDDLLKFLPITSFSADSENPVVKFSMTFEIESWISANRYKPCSTLFC
jgi:hypothetical protein